ncbi:hypothetical protein FSP39_016510 [Pinctada imbricata]|uniref:SH2 domain-containing protein n=1 Tax=Pinctada imbricata TaxID=66713 RepID=A0AA88XPQ7_PINIB|nr:hypothetical protein FSP39_016510 [Pinctada imbricata]
MALKETITHWHEGVTAYQEERYKDAVQHFEAIEDASARIYFNTACAYLRLNKVESAFMSLNETVKKDPHLAIGHFSRGIQQVKLRRFEGAINDFENAIQKLRGNRFINYLQLGMEHKLQYEDIAIAKAFALYSNGQSRDAIEVLVSASQRVEDDDTKKRLVDALHRVQSNGQGRGRIKSLSDEDWYHGTLARDEAENLLHYDGDFLIRQSKNRKTGAIQYVLSVYWQGYRHILCVQDDEEKWKFEGRSFSSISGLIRHQMKTKSAVTKRSRAELITPIGKRVDSNNPLDLIEIPIHCIFHPPKEFIANLQKRNYVAKAKVISSTNPDAAETLEIPEVRNSNRSSSSSNDRLSVASSTSGSDGYLTPKPSRPPPQLPPPKDNDGVRSSKSHLEVKEERRRRQRSGESRSRSRGRDHSADDTLSRRAPRPLPSEHDTNGSEH